MTNKDELLRFRAKDGILKTYFDTGDGIAFSSIVRKALKWSEGNEGRYRLLDTFFSDTLDMDLLRQIFQRASGSSRVEILVVDPTCPFAEHRAKSIRGRTTFERAHDGLMNIAKALGLNLNPDSMPLNATDPEDKALLSLIHQVEQRANVTLKFYWHVASGPLYFFKDILLCSRFCAGRSARDAPWSLVINEPSHKNDLFSVLEAEFNHIWNWGSDREPAKWLERERRVFLSHSNQDDKLAEEIEQRFKEQNIECFRASHISPGADWTDVLRKKLRSSIEFIVLLTPNSVDSSWVRIEQAAAWALGLNITPAFVQASLIDLPPFVGSQQAIDVSTNVGKEKLVKAVVDRMQKKYWILGQRQEILSTEF